MIDPSATLRARLVNALPTYLDELSDLVAIRSISADGIDNPELERCAQVCAELLIRHGFPTVEVLRSAGVAPAVWAELPGPSGSPVVLLYAHYDVQPVGDLARWTSSPWQTQVRDGRLYGRGTADDKAALLLHIAAVEALGSDRGVTIRILAEGDEEIGSPGVARLLDEHADKMRADVVVMPDAVNAGIGAPSLTVGLRGMVDLIVEVRTLLAPVHSGLYGGPAPDAVGVLVHLLASLTSPDGLVLVRGLEHHPLNPFLSPPDVEKWRTDTGVVPGVQIPGDSAEVLAQLVARPALTILGMDVPTVAESTSSLAPVARARVLVRLAPQQDAASAQQALLSHFQSVPARGAEVNVTVRSGSQGCALPTDTPLFQVALAALTAGYDRQAVPVAVGGSIPFASAYVAQFGAIPLLITAVQDTQSRAHGYDESLDLDAFLSAMHAEALLLQALDDA